MATVADFRVPFKAPQPQTCQHRVWCEHCDYHATLDEHVAGSEGDLEQSDLAFEMRREHAKGNPGHRARSSVDLKNVDTGADIAIDRFTEEAVRA